MDEPDEDRSRRDPGSGPVSSTGGDAFAPFARQHDVRSGPQSTWVLVASTLGPLLVIAVLLLLQVR
ncbi:hypothetical protein [Kineococcus sp. SYSU DK004]|uniref:hypothetical protein n=1 Tax=Kineococcus sp. SYSU DK004 TaxID=3383125 RepID=UPI003D7EE0B5